MQEKQLHKEYISLARDFIKQYPLGVLATINEDREPETAAMYWTIDDTCNLYFLSASKTRKLNNIDRNSMVSITFVDETEMKTMQVQGVGELIATTVPAIEFEKVPNYVMQQLLDIHVSKKDMWPTPAFKTGGGQQYVVKVTPTWMRLADFSQPTQDQSLIYSQIVG